MKQALALLVLGILSGCGQQAAPVLTAEKLDGSKVHEVSGPAWGKVEYAPRQYAGVAYDSTGVYANLHGVNPPGLVLLGFSALGPGKVVVGRQLPLFPLEFMAPNVFMSFPHDAFSMHGLRPDEFKWLCEPMAAGEGGSYGRSFWISWKALGLNGVQNGECFVSIRAMEQKGTGASFRGCRDSGQ